MVFNENSYLVRIWAEKVTDEKSGVTINDIPELFNLKEVVLLLITQEWFFYVQIDKYYKEVVYYDICKG